MSISHLSHRKKKEEDVIGQHTETKSRRTVSRCSVVILSSKQNGIILVWNPREISMHPELVAPDHNKTYGFRELLYRLPDFDYLRGPLRISKQAVSIISIVNTNTKGEKGKKVRTDSLMVKQLRLKTRVMNSINVCNVQV